jgi:hypothetical protein
MYNPKMKERKYEFPDLSPEMEVIFRSIGVEKNREVRIAEILKKGIDWATLETTAREHNVLPLLYTQLKNLDESLVRPEEMLRMEAHYRGNVLRSLRLAQTLHWIIEMLYGNGIDVIAFKGPALAVQAYGDLLLRTFADLDILVHPGDFYRTCDVLTAAGLHSSVPLNKHTKKYWRRFRRNIEFTDNINFIDIHQQVTPGPKRFGLKEKTWQNQNMVDLLFGKIPVLSPEHSLLCICVHAAQNDWGSLRSMADIAHLISRHPGLNWNDLIADARGIGCLRMLRLGLQLSQTIGGVELPAEARQLIGEDRETGELSKKFLQQLLNRSKNRTGKTVKARKLNDTLTLIRSMDSLAPRISYLAYFVFTPTILDWKVIKLPGFLWPVYFLVRPFRLFFKWVALLF